MDNEINDFIEFFEVLGPWCTSTPTTQICFFECHCSILRSLTFFTFISFSSAEISAHMELKESVSGSAFSNRMGHALHNWFVYFDRKNEEGKTKFIAGQ